MLNEAKDQVGYGGWGRWLTKNFDLSQQTARVYMRWAREQNARGPREVSYTSLAGMRGDTEREREHRQSPQQQNFRRVLRDVARDDFDHGVIGPLLSGAFQSTRAIPRMGRTSATTRASNLLLMFRRGPPWRVPSYGSRRRGPYIYPIGLKTPQR